MQDDEKLKIENLKLKNKNVIQGEMKIENVNCFSLHSQYLVL